MSEKITLADQIYADIKKDITNKQLVSGEKINIKELARKYGVSDTPVKQALQRLAEEKLVVNTPNKGMSVRTLTPHELNDTFDIRLMMDTFFIKDIHHHPQLQQYPAPAASGKHGKTETVYFLQ